MVANVDTITEYGEEAKNHFSKNEDHKDRIHLTMNQFFFSK
jgi:hypothetical protein